MHDCAARKHENVELDQLRLGDLVFVSCLGYVNDRLVLVVRISLVLTERQDQASVLVLSDEPKVLYASQEIFTLISRRSDHVVS